MRKDKFFYDELYSILLFFLNHIAYDQEKCCKKIYTREIGAVFGQT